MNSKSVSFDALTPLSDRTRAGVQTAIVYMLAGTGVSDLGQIGNVPEGEVKRQHHRRCASSTGAL